MALDGLECDDCGSPGEAECSPIGAAVGLRDTRHRPSAQPSRECPPIEWRSVRETERQRAFDDIATTPSGRSQRRRGEGETVANGVVELPDALEAGGERNLGEGEVGRLDPPGGGRGG